MCACQCLFEDAHMSAGTYESQKRVLNPKEQELLIVVTCQSCVQEPNSGPHQEQQLLLPDDCLFSPVGVSRKLLSFPLPGSYKDSDGLNVTLTLISCVFQRALLTPQRLSSLNEEIHCHWGLMKSICETC